jgi:hypothetical protein
LIPVFHQRPQQRPGNDEKGNKPKQTGYIAGSHEYQPENTQTVSLFNWLQNKLCHAIHDKEPKMKGRMICSDTEARERGFYSNECARRRQVLIETINAFETPNAMDYYHKQAEKNLSRWRSQTTIQATSLIVHVIPGDWGEVTLNLTSRYGICFAVLNMANAYVPGGAYIEGAIAQEENMFRRTDCHFRISDNEYDRESDLYKPKMTDLLSAENGCVYLDVHAPRVCVRGAEDRNRKDLGYPWLAEENIFPFFELRSSAQDLRDGSDFSLDNARKRIKAQFDTLKKYGIRNVVLGAFGCGAFQNPAHLIAQVYRQEIISCHSDFSIITFAIFSAGYGPDNYSPFLEEFKREKFFLPFFS